MIRPRILIRDHQLLVAVLVAAVIIIPRSIIITEAHSPSIDDTYHLYCGLLFLHRDFKNLLEMSVSDPPLGEALCACRHG